MLQTKNLLEQNTITDTEHVLIMYVYNIIFYCIVNDYIVFYLWLMPVRTDLLGDDVNCGVGGGGVADDGGDGGDGGGVADGGGDGSVDVDGVGMMMVMVVVGMGARVRMKMRIGTRMRMRMRKTGSR